jgi:Sec-independent protein secretion pathway component TatC
MEQRFLPALTKDGMTSWAFKLLSYLALSVSFVAGLIAILPVVVWFFMGALANDLMIEGDDCD